MSDIEDSFTEEKIIVKNLLITYITRDEHVMCVRVDSFNPNMTGMYMQYRIGTEPEVIECATFASHIDYDVRHIVTEVMNRPPLSHQELYDTFTCDWWK